MLRRVGTVASDGASYRTKIDALVIGEGQDAEPRTGWQAGHPEAMAARAWAAIALTRRALADQRKT